MRKLSSQSGFAAALLGTVLLLELVAVRIALTADSDFVYLFGRRINIVCAARQRFGVPCPTCGFTRGFVLSVHGRIGEAWKLSPSGPLLAIGTLGMSAILLLMVAFERRRTPEQMDRWKRWVQNGALAYGGLGTLIWVCSWIAVVTRLK